MIPTINKPTRVTIKTATTIDHIVTNSFVENTFKTAIINHMSQIIFQFAYLFLQQTYLQKMTLSINIKESLMMKKLKLLFRTSLNNLYPSKKILVHKKSITKTESIAENFNKYSNWFKLGKRYWYIN